jgi:hypothetical protein
MMMKSRSLKALVAVVLVGGALTTVGCSSGPSRITASTIRGNMTPELQTTAMTSEQHKTRVARSVDHTLRQIWDDLDYIFLVDQPSRLTPYPIP